MAWAPSLCSPTLPDLHLYLLWGRVDLLPGLSRSVQGLGPHVSTWMVSSCSGTSDFTGLSGGPDRERVLRWRDAEKTDRALALPFGLGGLNLPWPLPEAFPRRLCAIYASGPGAAGPGCPCELPRAPPGLQSGCFCPTYGSALPLPTAQPCPWA